MITYDQQAVQDLLKVKEAPTEEQRFLHFWDPGYSLLQLREIMEGKNIFYNQSWYKKEASATLSEEPQMRTILMGPLEGSFNKTFKEQEKMIPSGSEIPLCRQVVMGIVVHFLATGERLFSDCYIRCRDESSDGDLVRVGRFARDGVRVYHDPPDNSYDVLGVVLSRRS